MGEELWRRSASDLAAAIADGEVSAVEVVEAHLARIAAVNTALNAVTVVLADDAIEAAKAADVAVAAGQPLGLFHGVPFTVKENLDCVGSATTQGVPAFESALPEVDAPVVERMKAAGAIPLARTNLPDFGLRVHTDSWLRGLTRNPWARGRTAGGSSGGEASALATGMTPIGLGNDLGGSLRNPAFCCGIASLKPSFGRIPHASCVEPTSGILASQLMAVNGPMARRVADLRVALSVLAGPHPRDPLTYPGPIVGPPVEGPVRVAVVPTLPLGETDPAVSAGVRAAADALTDAGYDVVETEPPMLVAAVEVWGRWLAGELLVLRPLLDSVMSPTAMRFLDLVEHRFGGLSYEASVDLMVERHRIARAWSEFHDGTPLVLGPTWPRPAFEHGFDVAGLDEALATIDLLEFVVPQNLLGLPAVCVPVGLSDGLPIGVQVSGDRFREDLCLDAAEVVEDRLGVLTPIDPVT